MCEFVASLRNLSSREDRETAREWLSSIPEGMLVSVRGHHNSSSDNLSLLNIFILTPCQYEKGQGDNMAFVPVSIYRELNKVGGKL